MSSELNLHLSDKAHVEVTYDGEPSGMLPFASPLIEQDRRDLAWYLEIYGAHSLSDPGDAEAARIAARLPELGKALFDAVFSEARPAAAISSGLRSCPTTISGYATSSSKDLEAIVVTDAVDDAVGETQ